MPQKNWLITGVSSGFGRIMTEQLLARGDRIAGTVRERFAVSIWLASSTGKSW
jgi:NAD(P)-dependent dehydrogenase (short-subunit alcohol dehydrogenase family)